MYGGKNFRTKFMKQLRELEKEYTEKHEPFCYPCAKLNFEDEVKRVELELQRRVNTTDEESKEIKIDVGDLHKYAKKSFFKLIEEKPINEMTVVDGIKVPRRAFMRYEYRCDARNHGITVDMPWYVFEERNKKKPSANDDKKNS